jgi:hypothetical protein
LERVPFWNPFQDRVWDTPIDASPKKRKTFSKICQFCRLETLLRKASTHLHEVMWFSRIWRDASMTQSRHIIACWFVVVKQLHTEILHQVENWLVKGGNRQQATGNSDLKGGNRQQATGNRQQW